MDTRPTLMHEGMCTKQVLDMSNGNGCYTEFRCCTFSATCTGFKRRQALSRSRTEMHELKTLRLFQHRSIGMGAVVA